jgi:hypothetical protein
MSPAKERRRLLSILISLLEKMLLPVYFAQTCDYWNDPVLKCSVPVSKTQ